MSNPVTLRTMDTSKNRQIHEKQLYDKSQIRKHIQLIGNTSPYTRNPIVRIVEEKKKKKEILEFVKKVIAPKQKKQTKKDQKKISTPHKYNTRSRKKK